MAKILSLKKVKVLFPALSDEEAKLKLAEMEEEFSGMSEEDQLLRLEEIEKENSSSPQPKKYFISEKVLKDGYAGRIGDRNFVVAPHIYGETFTEKNEKVFGVTVRGGVVEEGTNTGKDYLENISDSELFELATAGVIITSKEDRERVLNHINKVVVKKVRK